MTREKIEQKAKEFCKEDVYGCNECCDECVQNIEKQKMIDLADWALSHQWVSVEDELPPMSEVVIAHYGNFSSVGLTFACWDGKGWMQEEKDITHWMPIPPMAEEGGEKK